MKGFGKLLLGFSFLTAALLLYVHERVEVLRASYRIYEKSSELAGRAEQFRRLSFEVSQLRSPQHLEKRLEELALPLDLPREIQVLRVPEPTPSFEVSPLPLRAPAHGFLDFVGQWIQVAQARTDE